MRCVMMICGLCLVLTASRGHAQQNTTMTPTSLTVLVIPATGDPLTVAPVPNGTRTTAISVTANCNLADAPPVAANPVNPGFVGVDDPFTAGRMCRVPTPTNLANGTYRYVSFFSGTCFNAATNTSSPCDTARSAVALPGPFSIQGNTVAGPAPADLRIVN